MAVNIRIEKKQLYLLSAVFIFLVGIGVVVAIGGTPTVNGHDGGELTGVCLSNGDNCPTLGVTCGWVKTDTALTLADAKANGATGFCYFDGGSAGTFRWGHLGRRDDAWRTESEAEIYCDEDSYGVHTTNHIPYFYYRCI